MKPRILISAALISVLSFAAASNAWADSIFLHIAGVTGTVTAPPAYVGDIEIQSYSQGFSNNGTSVQCSDTSVQKSIDVSSVFFARSVLGISTTPFTATFHFVSSGGMEDTTIVLHSVTVTSVSHGAAEGGGAISESISMHAGSLTVTFTDPNNGKKSYNATC
jgi:type VI protein secretion system component Hcp